jgi:hypothetical protein
MSQESANSVAFDRPMLKRLKYAYAKAVNKKAEAFKFDGREYVTDFAKYLIEYLESKLEH